MRFIGHWCIPLISVPRCESTSLPCSANSDNSSYSGRTDISPDGSRIVTYNLTKGIEVRTTADGAIHSALSTEVREKYILPVLFVHGDTAMVAGTTTGVANVWDSSSFQKIQALAHEGSSHCPDAVFKLTDFS